MNIQQLLRSSGLALSPDGAPAPGNGTLNAPTPTPTPAAGGQAPAGAADVVPLSKAEYARFVEAQTRLSSLENEHKELKDTWSNAELLLRQDSTAPAEKIQEATRKVLAKAGWTPAQIDAHLAGQQSENPRSNKPTRSNKATQAQDDEEGGEDEPNELEQIKMELGTLKQTQGKAEVARLNQIMQSQVSTAVDTTKDLSTVLATLVKANAPEDSEKAKAYEGNLRETVVAEVNRELLDRLKQRRAQNGNRWDEQWISEEAVNAAKAVATKLKKYSPDPSRIGRTDETSAADDFLINTKPMAEPQYVKGKTTMSDAQSQLREWAADHLMRGIHGGAN